MSERLKNLMLLIRWRDWALDKLPILYGVCFYLMMVNGRESVVNVRDFLVFIVFSVASTIYGYVINDYADIDIDLRQGKRNDLARFSPAGRLLMLIGITVIVIGSGSHFIDYPYFGLFWAIQFFIATFYSLPPIRFKERGLTGLIIPFMAQATVPMLICFAIFGLIPQVEMWPFLLYAIFKGGGYDIGHQFYDYEGDKQTETKTFAVQRGQRVVAVLFKLFLVLERISFVACLLVMLWHLEGVFPGLPVNPVLPMLIVYLLVAVGVIVNEIRQKEIIDPYYQQTRGLSNILHIIVPNILIPLLLTMLLILLDMNYIWLFLFFVIWIMPTPAKLKWPLEAVLKLLK